MRPGVLTRGVWRDQNQHLTTLAGDGEHVLSGVLRAAGDDWFPIINGVPCFLRGEMGPDLAEFAARNGLPPRTDGRARASASDRTQTADSFSDKWRRFRQYGFEPQHEEFLFGWYCRKLGLPDRSALEAFYGSQRTILEVGPGSGFNARFMGRHCPGDVFAADISDAAFTTFANTRDLPNVHVVQSDVMDLPFADGVFDFVIADGILHHTPDTRAAVRALYRVVRPGGQFFFYVYRKMGAARQFCDQHIREQFSRLESEECYQQCEGLTELGRELSRLNAKITLTKPIPSLGIPAGVHDVQRLVYYNFVKCFWNEAFDYETNNMVNYDWYHPAFAWQHTDDEVRGWLRELGVTDFAFHAANPNGISVLLRKPAQTAVKAA